ncbi:calcineurin-like phosphoesterase family protein [Tahibacter aquaticus]|uniref:Calcineurin-like phosphoesterase family protein n=1 Tax=Tahibacter aquaticus TaxID=520092 RepID=A0A4R6Z6V4_9GAMM|nr:metallophosphoesterase [Tahibacter aquaticus]TDR47501.1 calcineurin-like phosphoesterase family protein [Tahibacter aquaticus]
MAYYDLIGDVHGCAGTLRILLHELGYRSRAGTWRHPERRAIFVGDLIDRGPRQRETVDLVRRMSDEGAALCIMGNHEWNAIAYATPRADGSGYLREHSAKYRYHHQAFLDAYRHDEAGRRDALAWFRRLPLWLDLGVLRVVHATWDATAMQRLQRVYGAPAFGEGLLHDAFVPGSWQSQAIDCLLQGEQVSLNEGVSVADRFGIQRQSVRIRWWGSRAASLREAHLGPRASRRLVPDIALATAHWVGYGEDQPPVFFGHYWLDGQPTALAPNVACLDYSVAAPDGVLAAYRWSGEAVLDDRHFVVVPRQED